MANISNSPYVQLRETLRELGYPPVEPKVNPNFAPNFGEIAVPQFLTFSGLVNMVTRTFKYTFDEAMKESPNNARAMRRDPVCMDALRARQIPVVQLAHHLKPRDDTDPQQLYAAANVQGIIEDIPYLHWLKLQQSEAVWYGRYGNQLLFRNDFSMGYKRVCVRDHRPINGDKLVFKWSGDVGVLVHPLYGGDTQISDRGLVHFFTPEERQTVIIHHFEPEDADYYDFEMAGAVEGVGVRSRLYYFWYLKQMILKYLLDYMQRVGLGIDAFFYDAGNPASLAEMRMAAQNTMGSLRLLLPRGKDGTGPGYTHFEPSHTGAQMFIEFLSGYFDMIIRRYILGQSLTTEAGATGMGSGVAEAHQATQETLVSYDATALAETLTEQLVKPLYRLNHPGVPNARWEFDVEKPNVGEVMGAAQALYEMGVPIDADSLRSITGVEKPRPGSEIASKLQQSQASTVGVPSGVPVQSASGDPSQQQQQGQYPQSAAQYRRGKSSRIPTIGPRGYDLQEAPDSPLYGADDSDGIVTSPVQPIIRRKQLHDAMDQILSKKHNSGNRRSWSVVG